MIEAPVLLLDLAFIILAGTIFAFIARLLKQPLLVGYIIAGIVIGPIGLHLIQDYAPITVLAELGIAFLLFAIGMQIDFSKAWRFKKTILLGGLSQIVITAITVTAIMQYFGLEFVESIYIGMIMAFSSTAVAVKLLSDSNRLSSLEAKLIIGYLLIQDFAAVIALPLLANAGNLFSLGPFAKLAGGVIVLFLLAFVFSKKVLPRIMQVSVKDPEVFYLTTISTCFLFMLIAYIADFSIVVGAFIGGLALGKISLSSEALSKVKYIRDLFATIFFVSLGTQLSLSIFSAESAFLYPILLAIVFILNPLIFYIVTLYSGFGNKIAWFVGLSLAQASEFSFIIAMQGLNLGQISEALYNTVIWVILISMIATPYLMKSSGRVANFFQKLGRKSPRRRNFFERTLKLYTELPDPKELKGHIVVAGGGVFGGTIAQALKNKESVVVVDHDPETLHKLSGKKITAVYGSRTNEEIWYKVGLKNAKALVVTIPESETALGLVKKAKHANPKLAVFARAHYFKDAVALYNAKADFVVQPVVLGSNACLEAIQNFLSNGKVPSQALQAEYLRVLKEKAEEE